jgi:hypothetical protein
MDLHRQLGLNQNRKLGRKNMNKKKLTWISLVLALILALSMTIMGCEPKQLRSDDATELVFNLPPVDSDRTCSACYIETRSDGTSRPTEPETCTCSPIPSVSEVDDTNEADLELHRQVRWLKWCSTRRRPTLLCGNSETSSQTHNSS